MSNLVARSFSKLRNEERNTLFYIIDGLLMTLITVFVTYNNTLFVNFLGANSANLPFQLTLVVSLPQLASFIVLIPGGIVADSLRNKKKILYFALAFAAAFYFLILFLGLFSNKVYAFIGLVSVSTIGITLYSLVWQSVLLESVPAENINNTITKRLYFIYIIYVVVSPLTGLILTFSRTDAVKFFWHRMFFAFALICAALDIFVFTKIKIFKPAEPKKIHVKTFTQSIKIIAFKKDLRLFFIGMFVITTAWYMDSGTYVTLLLKQFQFNPLQFQIYYLLANLAGLITLPLWSKMNQKIGPSKTVIFGGLNLPVSTLFICIAICTMLLGLPLVKGQYFLLLLIFLWSALAGPLSLSVMQALFEIIDEGYKTTIIALYTLMTTFTAFLMPLVGTGALHILGTGWIAFLKYYVIVTILRTLALSFWIWRSFSFEKKRAKTS